MSNPLSSYSSCFVFTKHPVQLKTVTTNDTHTHTRLTALFPGLPGWAGTRKVKPIWVLLKQETVSDSGISWAIYKSAPRSRQTTMPTPHHSVFLQAGCPSCRPTNSVKVLKAQLMTTNDMYSKYVLFKKGQLNKRARVWTPWTPPGSTTGCAVYTGVRQHRHQPASAVRVKRVEQPPRRPSSDAGICRFRPRSRKGLRLLRLSAVEF